MTKKISKKAIKEEVIKEVAKQYIQTNMAKEKKILKQLFDKVYQWYEK